MAVTIVSNLAVPVGITGHGNQSHLVYAANQRRWWLFVCKTSTATTVSCYVSSSDYLGTATWSASTDSPPFLSSEAMQSDQRNLAVVGFANGTTDVVHVGVHLGNDATNNQAVEHVRATFTGASSIAWEAWSEDGFSVIADVIQGNAVGVSSPSRYVHEAGSLLSTAGKGGARRSTAGDAGPTWTNAFGPRTSIDTTGTNLVRSNAFAPLADDVMLAVYQHITSPPSIDGLRYTKSGAAGAWSFGTGTGDVGLGTTAQDQDDWCLCGVDLTHVYAVRRSGSSSFDWRVFDGGSWSTPANAVPSQAHLAGSGMFAATDGVDLWLVVLDSASNQPVKYVKASGASGAAPTWGTWTQLEAAGGTARGYVSGYPVVANHQVGVIYAAVNGSNYDIAVSGLWLLAPGSHVAEGSATLSGEASVVPYWFQPPATEIAPLDLGMPFDAPAATGAWGPEDVAPLDLGQNYAAPASAGTWVVHDVAPLSLAYATAPLLSCVAEGSFALSGSADASQAAVVTIVANLPTDRYVTGHGNQSHLVHAATQQRWWLFTLATTTADHVSCYVSSSNDLASATWSAAADSPAFPGGHAISNDDLNVGVLSFANGAVDVAHVSVGVSTGYVEHIRSTFTGASSISWESWTELVTAASGNSISGNALGLSSPSRYVHEGSIVVHPSPNGDPAARRSSNADTGAAWTNAWGASAVLDAVVSRTQSYAFAPLASDAMLVVYDNGDVGGLTDLRWVKYSSGTTWPTGSSGSVGAAVSLQNENDWCVCGVDATHVYAFVRSGSNTFLWRAFDGSSWSTPANAVPGQAHKSGSGLFAATDGRDIWLVVLDSASGQQAWYAKCTGASGATPTWGPWTSLAAGGGTRSIISGCPRVADGQVGAIWTQANGGNFDIQLASLVVPVPAEAAGTGGIVLTGVASPAASMTWAATGGITLAGAAGTRDSMAWAGSGGMTLSGAGGTRTTMAWTPAGGVVLSGVASVTGSLAGQTGSGGITITGVAGVADSAVVRGTGSVLLSGTPGVAATHVYRAGGTVTLGGTGGVSGTLAGVAATGGFILTGVATPRDSMSWSGTGGVTLTGVASTAGSMSCVASGGVRLTDVAAASPAMSWTSTGGVRLSGVASLAATYAYEPGGSVTLGGQMVPYVHKWTGSVTLSGEADAQGSTSANAAMTGMVVLTAAPRLVATYIYFGGGGDTVGVGGYRFWRSGLPFLTTGGRDMRFWLGGTPFAAMGYSGSGVAVGVSISGAALVSATLATQAGTGGVSLTGVATPRDSMSWAGTGGVALTGTPGLIATYVYRASGVVSLSGSAGVTVALASQAAGQVVLTGVAALRASYAYQAGGGASLSGSADVSSSVAGQTGTGGLTLTGPCDTRTAMSWTPAGGMSPSGVAGTAGSVVVRGTGGLVLTGQAGVAGSVAAEGSGRLVISGECELAGPEKVFTGSITLTGTVDLHVTVSYQAGGEVVLTDSTGVALSRSAMRGRLRLLSTTECLEAA